MEETMMNFLIDLAEEKEKYFKNHLFYAKKIKEEAEKILGKVKVYVFGSILRKNEIARDIDILIISPKLKNSLPKSKILAQISKKIGFINPFEIHLVSPEEYKNWYRYFIKEKITI